MKRLFLLMITVALLSAEARAQGDTIYPTVPVLPYQVLTGYKLSADQEVMFNASDGEISAFWHAWDDPDVVLDHIELNCTYNGNYLGNEYSDVGFTDEEDARMWVRAAWGENGIYLYFEVRDDQFVDHAVTRSHGDGTPHTAAEASWYNDAMDLYFDKFSTEMLYGTQEVLFINYKFNRVTINMRQVQYQFGSMGSVPETFSYNEVIKDPDGLYLFTEDRDFTFERAETEADGLIAEIIAGSDKGLDDVTQVMEWYFPWSQVGANGGTDAPSAGESKSVAFACGYNDADEGATDSDFIRWWRATDPFKRVPPPEGGQHVPTDGWGDIELVHEEVPPVAVIRPLQRRARSMTLARVEYYTPAGRLVAAIKADRGVLPSELNLAVPANTVLLERRISVTGETIAGKRLVHGGIGR